MKSIVLTTGRPYSSRLFWVLFGLNVPAAFALIPFALNRQAAYGGPEADALSGLGPMVIDRVVTLALIALLARLGLALANRIGLGLPFLESWVERVRPPRRLRGVVAVGGLVGLGCAALLLALEIGVFRGPMLRMLRELGVAMPRAAFAPPLYGFLAAISAGVTEETVFRLFGLSLLAWLGGLLVRSEEGRPRLAVLWTANVLFALVFGAAHLPDASVVGWPMNALVLTRTFTLNGLGGLAFGWLFWTFGLESAILAHFFADVGLYTLVPIILRQEGLAAQAVAGAAVALVLIPGVLWAVRTIAAEGSAAEHTVPTKPS